MFDSQKDIEDAYNFGIEKKLKRITLLQDEEPEND